MPAFHMHAIKNQERGRPPYGQRVKPFMLVLAPTRELSCQIMEEAGKFGRPIGIRSIVSLRLL